MLFAAIHERHSRHHRRFRLTAPEGTLWDGVPIHQAVVILFERDMEYVSVSIKLQGRLEGWPIPLLFRYNEDWDFLEPLCRFLSLDSSLGWTGYFPHNALINGMSEAFWTAYDRREYELHNRRPLPVSWCRSGDRIRPVAGWTHSEAPKEHRTNCLFIFVYIFILYNLRIPQKHFSTAILNCSVLKY